MKTLENTTLDTPKEHHQAKTADIDTVIVDSKTVASENGSANGQIGSTKSLRNHRVSESANETEFRSLFGRLHFRHEPDLPRSHSVIDSILTIICFVAVHYTYLGSLNLSSDRSIALVSALILLSLSLYLGGMYNTKKLKRLNKELTNLVVCWLFAFAAIGLFVFLSKTAEDISRVWTTLSMTLSLALLIGVRILGSMGLIARNKKNTRNIVILGHSTSINRTLDDLKKLTNSQFRLANVFDVPAHTANAVEYSGLLKNTADQLCRFIENQRQCGAAIAQVWIAASDKQPQIAEEISKALVNSPVDVCVIPDLYTERLLNGDVTRFGDTNIINISEISLSFGADQFKRAVDVIIASLALALLCIPMLVIAGLIKLESTGPVLFRQKRYGVDGREIEILKFRSMREHTDTEVQQATIYDTRVTRVGRIIRKTSLDELPQLLNVLNGTMSLVGPRPHAVAHNEVWRKEIQGYMLRHKVRPGITGWAQVNGWRGETDTTFKMEQRVKYDLEYIRNWSPWLDLKILALTLIVGFIHKNAY